MVYYVMSVVLLLYGLALICNLFAMLVLRRQNFFTKVKEFIRGPSYIVWATCFFYSMYVTPTQKYCYFSSGLIFLLIGISYLKRVARTHYYSPHP
ncbi:MAG: hypothetical protein UW94_C0020G0032 [Parcubacteria group bacterium GW2011_GWA2_45_14]|nr:MAG: hypothetical protein UW94_C0020G0032 [Parcubacteria group bacterium GW2011_GWA2_45_14]